RSARPPICWSSTPTRSGTSSTSPGWPRSSRTARGSADPRRRPFAVLAHLRGQPGLEAAVAGQAHHSDGGPASDPALRSEDLGQKIGEAARHPVDVVEVWRANDEVQRPHDRHDVVEIPQGLLEGSETVDAGETCRLVPLLEGDRVAEAPRVELQTILLRDVT